MSDDKMSVGKMKDGRRFFSVVREGRKMPLLNGNGEVEFWSEKDAYTVWGDNGPGEFARVLDAMNRPEKLKVVSCEL